MYGELTQPSGEYLGVKERVGRRRNLELQTKWEEFSLQVPGPRAPEVCSDGGLAELQSNHYAYNNKACLSQVSSSGVTEVRVWDRCLLLRALLLCQVVSWALPSPVRREVILGVP